VELSSRPWAPFTCVVVVVAIVIIVAVVVLLLVLLWHVLHVSRVVVLGCLYSEFTLLSVCRCVFYSCVCECASACLLVCWLLLLGCLAFILDCVFIFGCLCVRACCWVLLLLLLLCVVCGAGLFSMMFSLRGLY
jgi:hypothetical protein